MTLDKFSLKTNSAILHGVANLLQGCFVEGLQVELNCIPVS